MHILQVLNSKLEIVTKQYTDKSNSKEKNCFPKASKMVRDIENACDNSDDNKNDQVTSDCEEEMAIFPLELEDLYFRPTLDNGLTSENIRKSKKMGQLRFSQPLVNKWRQVSRAALSCQDPWAIFRIVEVYPEEECIRHRYSAFRQQWVTDRVCVKMQTESFGRGAMRECFRLKKLPGSLHNQQLPHGQESWSKALNYVAKRYLTDVDRKIYFMDVQLQADAKLWSEEFNRHNPPKKIDIMQVSILEFPNRTGQPLYHLEHFIEGEYIKYNSNSGFVSDQARQTPQAFSHFTFERSGHQLIVVDIQGVGDLYTDPQIHSADAKSHYGDGDLGTRGMALFFHTHECDTICEHLGLTPFDLSPCERAALKNGNKNILASDSQTVCSGSSVELCQSPSFSGMDFLRQRTTSKPDEDDASVHFTVDELDSKDTQSVNDEEKIDSSCHMGVSPALSTSTPQQIIQRHNHYSTNSDALCESGYSSEYSTSLEVESDQWKEKMEKLRKPSCIPGRVPDLESFIAPRCESLEILGTIHMDLTRYYEMGRFNSVPESATGDRGASANQSYEMRDKCDYDMASAWFHLDMAGRCGILEAVTAMAKIYLGLPHDLLQDFVLERGCLQAYTNDDALDPMSCIDHGIDLMEEAAHRGDKASMLYMAEAYETGRNLGTERSPSWIKAIDWYEKAVGTPSADEQCEKETSTSVTWNNDVPRYKILAKLAEMYHKGGPLLSPDLAKAGELYSEAAESAAEAMHGKLASKLYMLAEEAWAGVEEDE